MQYAQNLDGVVFDSIRQDKRRAANDQLARPRYTTDSACVGVFSQKLGRFPNTFNYFSSCFWII